MDRREIITMTVIVNVILLSILFFTANRLEEPGAEVSPPSTTLALASQEEPLTKETPSSFSLPPPVQQELPVDEFDFFLQDFAAAVTASQQQQQTVARQQVIEETAVPTVVAKASSSVSSKSNATAATPEKISEVIVKKGDFLERIARQNHSTVEAIKAANHMTSDQLKVGQVLKIPMITPAEKIDKKSGQTTTSLAAGENVYRVKSGDSPWKIAKQHQVSVEELLRLNHLDEATAKNLKPGDLIRVP